MSNASEAPGPDGPARPGARVVVRGGGSIGQRHARVFRGLGADVALWPVRPRDGAHPTDAATGARLVDDGSAPEAVAAADLVVVATDTGRHVADAAAALDSGARRVLLEKPVAPRRTDAEPLAAHPRAGDVWVAAPLRAHQGFRHLLDHVAQVGGPLSVHVWCQSWLPDWRPERDYRDSYSARADEGGVLRDLVHELDYATALLGVPTLLGARLEHEGPLEMEAEQAATLLWRTASATVTCRLDYTTRPATRGITLRGPDGSLEWHVGAARVVRTTPDGQTIERTFLPDLDRDVVMATQARAALELAPDDAPHPAAGSDPARRHTVADTRLRRGAPATLAEGLAVLDLCDRAREIT